MTAKQDESNGLDDLLRKALAVELPADVEAGMRERIALFRAGTIRDEGRTAAWLFPRSAWAVLSILMLAAGILLQGLGSRNPLAEKIAHIKAKAEVSGPDSIERRSGDSGIRVIAPDGDRVRFPGDKEVST